MNNLEAIATLKDRLALAGRNADMLRQVGTQEQYLASYFLAEALELQLGTLMNAQRRPPAP